MSAMPVSAAEVGYGNLYFIVNNEENTAQLSTYNGTDTNVVIPDEVYGYKVTSIAPRVFYENNTIETISIPDTVDTIGLYAFAFCSKLQSVTLGENVTNLGDSVFLGCNSLESAQINCNIEKLPRGTFEKCSSLNDVTLSDTISEIGNTAFMDCASLEILPINMITQYGSNCFLGTGVTKVDVADGVTNIPWMCFANCYNLSEITIPSSVSSIDDTAFYNIENQFTIKCFNESFALDYAQNNNISYIILMQFILGDVDGVDNVNINDVTAIQSHLAEINTVEGVFLLAADANQDDIVDISDATAIQMKLAEYVLPYPIGQYVTKEVVTQESN